MWNILKIASAFIGIIVGAGFASGQEVLQYFTSFGHWGQQQLSSRPLFCLPRYDADYAGFPNSNYVA